MAAVAVDAARGAWIGGRAAARAARAARRAGTDRTTRVRRALVTGVLAGTAAARAARRAAASGAGVRGPWRRAWRLRLYRVWRHARDAAVAVVTARRADPTTPAPTSPADDGPPVLLTVPDGQQNGGRDGGQDVPAAAAGDSTTSTTDSTDGATDNADGRTDDGTGGGAGRTTTMGDLIVAGDLETTEELREEVTAAQNLLDEASDAVSQLVAWAGALPDRMQAAPWETAAVLARVEEISDVLGTLEALDDAGESLTAMTPALDEADGLGEHAGEIDAGGPVESFQPA